MSLMRTFFISASMILITVIAGLSLSAHAQTSTLIPEIEPPSAPTVTEVNDRFYRAEIVEIVSEREEDLGILGTRPTMQLLKLKLLSGPDEGGEVELEYGALTPQQRLRAGQKIVVVVPNAADPGRMFVFEPYRLSALFVIALFFAGLAVALAGRRGFFSLIGLGFSVAVLVLFVVPQITAGKNPLVISLIGSFIIVTVSIYLAHGVSHRTSIALGSTCLTILIAALCSWAFVALTRLAGFGSEEAYSLQLSPAHHVSLKGLLLGGIIIGALGVLDDITTAQAAVVDELHRANPSLSKRELYRRAFSIGREHITSLVNTLVLAYAGASLPALLLFTIYNRPAWVILNTEVIAEEIIRTLVGSIALMCAVPITTLLAVHFLRKEITAKPSNTAAIPHIH